MFNAQIRPLTKAEVAAGLDVTERTIDRYMRQRRDPLPFIRFNARRIRFNPQAVESWISRRTVGGEE